MSWKLKQVGKLSEQTIIKQNIVNKEKKNRLLTSIDIIINITRKIGAAMIDLNKSKPDKIKNNKLSCFKNKNLSDKIILYNSNNSTNGTNNRSFAQNQTTFKKIIECKVGSNSINKFRDINDDPIINYRNLKQKFDKNSSGLIKKTNIRDKNPLDNALIDHKSSLLGKIMILNDVNNQYNIPNLQRNTDTDTDTLIIKRYPNHLASKGLTQSYQNIASSNKNRKNGKDSINMTLHSNEKHLTDKWSASPSTNCKIKKLTFVKTVPVSNGNISNVVGHHIPNYERVILNNTNFVRQSAKYTFENNKLIIEKPSDKSNNEELLIKNEDLLTGVIFSERPSSLNDTPAIPTFKFQMYQMDNHVDHKNWDLKQSKKTNIHSNSKSSQASINPPVLEGYSTYTFKVNLKDK